MRKQLVFFALSFVLLAVPAHAQVNAGLRVGASADPDQFFFGGHVETKELVPQLTFRPNVEVGIGNDETVFALNFELAYKFTSKRPWNPYVVAGPALIIRDTESDTSANGGFNIGLGIEHHGGLFGEVKIGAIDSPNFKVAIGYRFAH